MSLQDIADCMKAGVQPDVDFDTIQAFLGCCLRSSADLTLNLYLDSGMNTYQTSMTVRAAVLERIEKIQEMMRVASSRGFILPTDPFIELNRLNQYRRLFDPLPLLSGQIELTLSSAAKLSEITALFISGDITFERKPAFQLTSYELSVDGSSPQSGDALTDILGYQPDGDFIKRKRALDSLAKLDFSKRRPYLLFTCDFDDAALVCWSRMHDASGYKISRRDVFATVDLPPVYLENKDLINETNGLMADDRFYQILTFYDWLDHSDVLAHVDRSVPADTLYSFTISGVQKRAPGTPFIFDVPAAPLFFSPSMAAAIQTAVEEEAARFKRNPQTISPFPALAQLVYGDSSYGWILAGVNVVESIRRGDSPDLTRAMSFIGSTVDGVSSAGQSGRLVIPKDIGSVTTNVENSISSYGVSQSIVSILDGLGMTEFISGKDDLFGTPTAAEVDKSTSGLSRILSVIDPATATIDTTLLVSTLSNHSLKLKGNASFTRVIQALTTGVPIDQAITAETIDLTTYSGIGRLVQVLRTIYDFFPGSLS